MLGGDELLCPRQHRPALVGQHQDVGAAIVGRTCAGAEIAAFQAVEHRHEVRPEDAERVGDFGLIAPRILLEQQQHTRQSRFPRHPASLLGNPDEPPPIDLEEVQIWDLLSAFDRLMKEVGTRKPRYHEVLYDDTPIDLHAADIEDRLKREHKLTLRQLIVGRKSRSEMIGVFLAFDIILFYVFFELTLVPLFCLIGIWGGPERRHSGGTTKVGRGKGRSCVQGREGRRV